MSILDVTYHSLTNATAPKYAFGGTVGTIPPQTGDSEQLDFTSGTDEGAVQSDAVLAIFTPDADCRVCAGVGATATVANSRLCKADITSEIYVPAGGRVSVRAA